MATSKFPLLSVVIPVYNAEKYLAETLESVIAQDIGFQDNIEIILINDGSTDKSEEVCLAFKNKYPDNIRYIKQKNAGVSAARNKGIDTARGKYISFLDSDDKYSLDSASKVCKFFDEHYDEIDVVAIKLVFFDAKTGDHMLNYKFTKTRVIDIEKEPECVQLSGGSVFIKTKTIQKQYYFDRRIKFSEDSKFLTEVILEKSKYGVVSDPVLYYRRRKEQDSAINTSLSHREWYFDTTQHVYAYLLDYSVQKNGYVSSYVQHLVMYDLQWRLKQSKQTVLNPEEEDLYKKTIYDLLRRIDESVIMAQRWLPLEYKIFALKIKHGQSYEKNITVRGGAVYLNDTLIWDYVRKTQYFNIEFISVFTEKTELYIEGFAVTPATKQMQTSVEVDGKILPLNPVERKYTDVLFLGDRVAGGYGFAVTVPIGDKSKVCGVIALPDGTRIVMPLRLLRRARLGNMSYAYRRIKNHIITKHGNQLGVIRWSKLGHVAAEVKYSWKLIEGVLLGGARSVSIQYFNESRNVVKKSRKPQIVAKSLFSRGKRMVAAIRAEGVLSYVRKFLNAVFVVCVRLAYYATRTTIRKEIWIITDRINAAGDNGEALFRYMQKQDNKDIKTYFAIAKNSPDYKKMKSIGRVVDRNSRLYKVLFLLSSKVISSHADEFIINPFTKHEDYFIDLLRFRFVFLQHGITMNDLSAWLNRYKKNIALFVTSAELERSSILNNQYFYEPENVVLTGFPRYDNLISAPRNKLVIMPTWRKFIAIEANAKNGSRDYDPKFKSTEYFRFYQDLLDDKRITSALMAAGMIAEFYLHPSHQAQIHDFIGNEQVQIMQFPFDYKKAFREGNLLVTDYSSVAFDFAYMKKPVIYCQFDEQKFFGNHWDRGYFSYDKHGFGPVVRDYEATVKEIVKLIENDCNMEEKYKKRVEKFFAYTDKNNSQRVYKAILEMPK